MSDKNIEYTGTYYGSFADQTYQDYLEYSFYEFLLEMQEECMVPKPYSLPINTATIKQFWEVA